MLIIIRDVIFPIMSYSAEDEELWNTNPHEYIRVKFDFFEDFVSPVAAASNLLVSCCRKRKDMLQKCMQLVIEVLSAGDAAGPRQKDGALHITGSLAEHLRSKAEYRSQLDGLVAQYVFPEFASPFGHMRARACWTLQFFKLQQEANLIEAVRLTTNALLTDPELPVKVEAAIALQNMLKDQERVQKHLEPQIKQVTLELLNIIRETENDDLTSVLSKIVCKYKDQLCPIAIEICTHLATTFSQLLESDESTDEKAITAMGLLNTMETLVIAFGQQNDILNGLEPIVLQVVCHILQNSFVEFYEEALNLIFEMTNWRISTDMWKCLDVLFDVFVKDGFDYFTDMMPALHNYITIDTKALLNGGPESERRILGLLNMCQRILNGEPAEEAECHAAKLLEVMILQCGNSINTIIPTFLELVLARLTRKVQSSELRTMCLQVRLNLNKLPFYCLIHQSYFCLL